MDAQGKGSRASRSSRHIHISDWHGASLLGLDAVGQVIDIVESLHGKVLQVVGWDVTSGIAGSTYRRARATTAFAGRWIDARLGVSAPAPGAQSSAARETVLAALNGVFGDLLAATGNPLAIGLQLRRHGCGLDIANAALAAAIPAATGKIALLVHGLCRSDLHWRRNHHDHGEALAKDLGYTPVYLHYNSGLHISANGREFAGLIERLVQEWPVAVEEVALIGHSMGGLVARSACFYGNKAGHAWVGKLKHMVFLGTPHHGVPLERIGNWLGATLGRSALTAPLARLGRLRSAGITDLRYGNLVDEDWHGKDRFEHEADQRRTIPLPRGVKCYALAGSTGRRPGDLRDRLLGDGLIPLDTALGRHPEAARTLAFPEGHTWIVFGIHHLGLLGGGEVYDRIRGWLGDEPKIATKTPGMGGGPPGIRK